MKILRTSQLNFAGNADFINLVNRGETKEFSKKDSVQSLIPYDAEVSVGFGFIGMQNDNKICRLYFDAENFGGNPVRLWVECSIEDSANAAGLHHRRDPVRQGRPWIGRSADRCTRSRRT